MMCWKLTRILADKDGRCAVVCGAVSVKRERCEENNFLEQVLLMISLPRSASLNWRRDFSVIEWEGYLLLRVESMRNTSTLPQSVPATTLCDLLHMSTHLYRNDAPLFSSSQLSLIPLRLLSPLPPPAPPCTRPASVPLPLRRPLFPCEISLPLEKVRRDRRALPFSRRAQSHIFTVPSSLQETKKALSSATASLFTDASCSRISIKSRPRGRQSLGERKN